MDADHLIAPVAQAPRVTGATTIYGVVTNVGGLDASKNVRLRTRTGDLTVHMSESLARKVAQHIFDEVGLEGTAVWDSATMSLVAFDATRLLEYRRTSASEAFERLRDVAGEDFDEVDPDEYVRRLRGGGGA